MVQLLRTAKTEAASNESIPVTSASRRAGGAGLERESDACRDAVPVVVYTNEVTVAAGADAGAMPHSIQMPRKERPCTVRQSRNAD